MAKQSYHDNTEHNVVFGFVFKKMAARFPEMSGGEETRKLSEKAVNKNTVKTTKTWMNV